MARDKNNGLIEIIVGLTITLVTTAVIFLFSDIRKIEIENAITIEKEKYNEKIIERNSFKIEKNSKRITDIEIK